MVIKHIIFFITCFEKSLKNMLSFALVEFQSTYLINVFSAKPKAYKLNNIFDDNNIDRSCVGINNMFLDELMPGEKVWFSKDLL